MDLLDIGLIVSLGFMVIAVLSNLVGIFGGNKSVKPGAAFIGLVLNVIIILTLLGLGGII